MARIALALGVMALITSIASSRAYIFLWLASVAVALFGIAASRKALKMRGNTLIAVAGLVLSSLGLIICAVWTALFLMIAFGYAFPFT